MIYSYFKKIANRYKYRCLCHKPRCNDPESYSDPSGSRIQKRILVFGDSNAFRPARSTRSWPHILEKKDPLHLIVLNESADGRTVKFDNGDLNGLSVIGNKLNAHLPLDNVIVALGTNDLKRKYGPPQAADIVEGMDRILKYIKSKDEKTEPILVTPPPLGSVRSGELIGAQQRISRVVAGYIRLSKYRDVQLINIYPIIDIRKDLESDMIHLNDSGRCKVANAVFSQLKVKIRKK